MDRVTDIRLTIEALRMYLNATKYNNPKDLVTIMRLEDLIKEQEDKLGVQKIE